MITFKYGEATYGVTGVKSGTVFARKTNGGGKLVRGRDAQFDRNEVEKILGKPLEEGVHKVEDPNIDDELLQDVLSSPGARIIIYANEVILSR